MASLLTQDQRDAITVQKKVADASVTNAQGIEDATGRAITNQNQTDSALAAVYGNFDAIITQYDTEIRWLTGMNVDTPVTVPELQAFVNGTSNRLELVTGNTMHLEPKRISQFDRSPKIVFGASDFELQSILYTQQTDIFAFLQGGLPLVTVDGSTHLTSGSSVSSGTTTLTLLSSVGINFATNSEFFIQYGSDTAVAKTSSYVQNSTPSTTANQTGYAGTGNGTMSGLTTGISAVTETITVTCTTATLLSATFSVIGSVSGSLGSATTGSGFTSTKVSFSISEGTTKFLVNDAFTISVIHDVYYHSTLTLTWVVPPPVTFGDTASIAQVATFGGFSNSERAAHTASNPGYQSLLNYWINTLNSNVGTRKTAQTNQLSAYTANVDPNKDPAALTSLNTSLAAINTFLGGSPPGTINITDSGISIFSAATTARKTFADGREAAINSTISTGSMTNKRYDFSDIRFNRGKGTAKSVTNLNTQLSGIQTNKAATQELSSNLTDILDNY